MYKVLGVLQLISLLIVALNIYWGWFPSLVLLAVGFFIFKGLTFGMMHTPLSYMDAVFGFYFLMPVFGIASFNIVNLIAMFYLGQKGITYLMR